MDSMEELRALKIQETVEDGMEQMMMTGKMKMVANTEKIVQKIEIIVANMMKKTIGSMEDIMVVEAVEIIEAMVKGIVMGIGSPTSIRGSALRMQFDKTSIMCQA